MQDPIHDPVITDAVTQRLQDIVDTWLFDRDGMSFDTFRSSLIAITQYVVAQDRQSRG